MRYAKKGPDMLQHAEAFNAGKSVNDSRDSNDSTKKPQYSREQIEAAKLRAARYAAWRRINGQAYRYAEALALREAEHGRRVSGSWLVGQIRAKDIANDEGAPCRPNNDHAALMVREIIAKHPEVAQFVERRTNVYDRLAGGDGEAE